jgi:hypothetical protein
MKTSMFCAAAVVALTALAGGARAQLLGGAAGMVGGAARSTLSSVPVGSTLNGVTSDAGAARGAAAGQVGDAVRSDVAGLRSRAADVRQDTASQVRSVQGELGRSHALSAAAAGQSDLIAGDLHAVFRDYAGLNGRTTALETRGLTEHANDTARMAVRKVHNRGGDVIEITHDRADQALARVDDVRDDATDRVRGTSAAGLKRAHATARHATGAARSDVQRVVAAAHDLKGQAPNIRPAVQRVVSAAHALRGQPAPSVRANVSGSASLTVASTDANAKAKARANTRSRRASAGVSAAGAAS